MQGTILSEFLSSSLNLFLIYVLVDIWLNKTRCLAISGFPECSVPVYFPVYIVLNLQTDTCLNIFMLYRIFEVCLLKNPSYKIT